MSPIMKVSPSTKPPYTRVCSSQRRSKISPRHDGTDIGENALCLAIEILKKHPSNSGRWIFQALVPMVASCVFYDCVWSHEGRAIEIFNSCHGPSLELMLRNFCNLYWPCSFIDESGQRCAKKRSNHPLEAHHTSKGKIIGVGAYESNFSAAAYSQVWIGELTEELRAIQEDFCELLDETASVAPYKMLAEDLHVEQINDFYEGLGMAKDYSSHTSCFCCLAGLACHPLPCGHVLCESCVRRHGRSNHSRTVIEVDYCPLHTRTKFSPPWEVTLVAEHAGVRVLCLDGGGIRGIIELEVLRAIEKALGDRIPIQSFFDLIVGTSTGGINALALGVKRWPVQYCTSIFEKLCNQAFTERELHGVWGLGQAAFLNHGSIYKAKPLHNVFQEMLGHRPLFGSTESLNAFRAKVAVTATTGDGKEAVIIANYGRPQVPNDGHLFLRPDDPTHEFELWEAAAATSAAPFYFKPFLHTKSGMRFLDGGLYHNNPINVANRERKLLWPHTANEDPDILLSIGTGQGLSEFTEGSPEKHPLIAPGKDPDQTDKSPKRSSRLRRTFDTFDALYKRFDNILDSEQTWTDFEADLTDQQKSCPSPYIRFNLDLKRKPPPFDAKDKLQELQQDTKERLNDPENLETINHIASLLVASSFCFKVARVTPQSDGSHVCIGSFSCKFDEGSSDLRGLGTYLQKQKQPGFMPYFIFHEQSQSSHSFVSRRVALSNDTLSKMSIYGMFQLPPCKIQASHPEALITAALVLGNDDKSIEPRMYPLSRFPRAMLKDVPLEASVQANRTAHHGGKENTLPGKQPIQPRPGLSYRMPCHRPYTWVQQSTTISRPTMPYQNTGPTRVDSGLELPQSLRIAVPHPRKPSEERTPRPRSMPNHQAARPWMPAKGASSPENLPERAIQKFERSFGKGGTASRTAQAHGQAGSGSRTHAERGS